MKIIKFIKTIVIIKNIILLLSGLFLIIGWINYDAKNHNILWLALSIGLLIFWNFLKYFVPSYKIDSNISLEGNTIRIENQIINLNEVKKISFFKNGFKGKKESYNFFALNHFMPNDGINKLDILFESSLHLELFIILNDAKDIVQLEQWFDNLTVHKSKSSFHKIL